MKMKIAVTEEKDESEVVCCWVSCSCGWGEGREREGQVHYMKRGSCMVVTGRWGNGEIACRHSGGLGVGSMKVVKVERAVLMNEGWLRREVVLGSKRNASKVKEVVVVGVF